MTRDSPAKEILALLSLAHIGQSTGDLRDLELKVGSGQGPALSRSPGSGAGGRSGDPALRHMQEFEPLEPSARTGIIAPMPPEDNRGQSELKSAGDLRNLDRVCHRGRLRMRRSRPSPSRPPPSSAYIVGSGTADGTAAGAKAAIEPVVPPSA